MFLMILSPTFHDVNILPAFSNSELIAVACLVVGYGFFAHKRLLRTLHLFQQEEYDPIRLLRLLWQHRACDRKASALLLIIWALQWLASMIIASPEWAPHAALAAGLMILARREPDPRRNAKKKLNLTARAQRIVAIAALYLTACAAILLTTTTSLLFWLLMLQGVPIALIAANLLLVPWEKRIQLRYWAQAHDKLAQLNPIIIGITGSYGKTSVKHCLGHFLAAAAPILMTPGSVNTPMGIARIIRERLSPEHRFFLCEMGAYGVGSIARLCRLAPPNIGLITAIGIAHYERFQSREAVAIAKNELPTAVLQQPQGRVLMTAQAAAFAPQKSLLSQHRDRCSLVAAKENHEIPLCDHDVVIESMTQTRHGITVILNRKGETIRLATPLFGQHQGHNIAIAFAAAADLGVDITALVAMASTLPQIPHRLEVKHCSDGSILIDDAYNANPKGFLAGLEVLDFLAEPQGRRILITPGMVELGTLHEDEHAKLGAHAADYVDILLAVAPERISTLIDAFQRSAPTASMIPQASFAEAASWLETHRKRGDVILIANDLPDIYENPPRF